MLNNGDSNTATGAAALLLNTTGIQQHGQSALERLCLTRAVEENTATGAFALYSNTEGDFNTANGEFALLIQHHR